MKGRQQQRAGMGLGPREGLSFAVKAKSQKRKIEIESQGQQDLSHLDGYTEAEIYTSQALSTVQQEISTAERDARYDETTTSWVRPDSQPGTHTQTRLCRLRSDPTDALFLS